MNDLLLKTCKYMDGAANDPGEIDLTQTEKLFFKHSLMCSVYTYSKKLCRIRGKPGQGLTST